jgi:hypothetical protein
MGLALSIHPGFARLEVKEATGRDPGSAGLPDRMSQAGRQPPTRAAHRKSGLSKARWALGR